MADAQLRSRHRFLIAHSFVGLLAYGLACSSSTEKDGAGGGLVEPGGDGDSSGATGGTGGKTSGAGAGFGDFPGSSTGGGGTVDPGPSNTDTRRVSGCPGIEVSAADDTGGGGVDACVGEARGAEGIPVDLYIMMDRSESMNRKLPGGTLTRWEGVKDAVQRFVVHPEASELRVGIQFFSHSGSEVPELDCDPANYAQPAVEIGDLPDNAAAIVAAIDEKVPAGKTPTIAALQGAVDHAVEWANNNPGRSTMVVFVTDGLPTVCNQNLADIAAVAGEGLKNERGPVRTFVIGLFAGESNLLEIARSGGTTAPLIVETGDVAEPFLNEMLNFTNSKIRCDFEIPKPSDPTKQVDFTKVQMLYQPDAGNQQEIPKVNSSAECGNPNGGWYYDNPASPTRIVSCPCTCANFRAGLVTLALGCSPKPVIR